MSEGGAGPVCFERCSQGRNQRGVGGQAKRKAGLAIQACRAAADAPDMKGQEGHSGIVRKTPASLTNTLLLEGPPHVWGQRQMMASCRREAVQASGVQPLVQAEKGCMQPPWITHVFGHER